MSKDPGDDNALIEMAEAMLEEMPMNLNWSFIDLLPGHG
jgi:hypothetical protein